MSHGESRCNAFIIVIRTLCVLLHMLSVIIKASQRESSCFRLFIGHFRRIKLCSARLLRVHYIYALGKQSKSHVCLFHSNTDFNNSLSDNCNWKTAKYKEPAKNTQGQN